MLAENTKGVWRSWLEASLEMVFPQCCAFCHEVCPLTPQFPGICRSCLSQLPLRPSREACLKNLKLADDPKNGGADIYCAAYYQGLLRQALLRFKFGDATDLAPALASLLILQIEHSGLPIQAVVAVPLHRVRLRERGYNQAGLLASEISRRLKIPDWSSCLFRSRATDRQSEQMDRECRLLNLSAAFGLSTKSFAFSHGNQVGSQKPSILLVDDILTTGITLIEAARPLRQAGFSVVGLVVASNHQ